MLAMNGRASFQQPQENDADIKPILEWVNASAPKWSDSVLMNSTAKNLLRTLGGIGHPGRRRYFDIFFLLFDDNWRYSYWNNNSVTMFVN